MANHRAVRIACGLALALSLSEAEAQPTPAQRCAARKMRATATRAKRQISCYARAALRGRTVDTLCLVKAEAEFLIAFARAEEGGGCITTSDDGSLASVSDVFVEAVVTALPDDVLPTPTPTSTSTPTPSIKVIFATSTTTNGALGGLVGADALCQNLASTAGLHGTFKAWLSSTLEWASSRLTQSTVPYVLPGSGEIVANNWFDLTNGSLDHAIDRDESGSTLVSPDRVWTGSATNGDLDAYGDLSVVSCDDWTTSGSLAGGRSGSSTAADVSWSYEIISGCGQQGHLYCLEQ